VIGATARWGDGASGEVQSLVVGRLRALRVDQELGSVVSVLVSKQVIPVGQVADFDGGVHLGVSKRAARHSD